MTTNRICWNNVDPRVRDDLARHLRCAVRDAERVKAVLLARLDNARALTRVTTALAAKRATTAPAPKPKPKPAAPTNRVYWKPPTKKKKRTVFVPKTWLQKRRDFKPNGRRTALTKDGLIPPTPIGAGTGTMVASAVFVISSVIQDRSGDIVQPSGCKLENYKKIPVVFFAHQGDPYPIGTSEDPKSKKLAVKVLKDRVEATVFFYDDERSQKVAKMVQRGVLRGASIGFQPLKMTKLHETGENSQLMGYEITEWDLLEWSIVGVPDNPNAIVQSVE